jgi:hypothetical protein
MAHDPEPGHRRQVLAQLPERLAIALEQPIEEQAPAPVTECPEHWRQRVVCHRVQVM